MTIWQILSPERSVDLFDMNLGAFNLMRNLGGAIGIAACGTILNDRGNLHFERIAEHLTAADAQVMGLLDSAIGRYAQALGDPAHAQTAALKGFGCWR
jgi:DHA2 family multidrug resistance protein